MFTEVDIYNWRHAYSIMYLHLGVRWDPDRPAEADGGHGEACGNVQRPIPTQGIPFFSFIENSI